ncbi:MAG: response regulator [Nitrospira sp.]|nr:response regulator [Nitrospira sp.]
MRIEATDEVRKNEEHVHMLNQTDFRSVADTAPAMLWVTEPNGSCSFLSCGWYEYTGQTEQEGLGKDGFGWLDAVHPDDYDQVRHIFLEANEQRRPFRLDYRVRRHDGEYSWAVDEGRPRFGRNGEFLGYVGSVLDITDRKRHEILLHEQYQFLELIARGCPLEECLTALTAAVTRLQPDARAAVLMANPDRTAMADVYSRLVPASFGSSIAEAPVNELAIGTCGTAIFTGKPVTCPDIAGSDWSKPWRELCLAHGIRACHSTPVFGPEDKAVASFFLCYAETREPHPWERRVAEFGAHIAGIALERDRVAHELRENEERAREVATQLEHVVAERTKELVQSQNRLRALAAELSLSEQRERKRLATELHDYLAQLLAVGKMSVDRIKQETGGPLVEELDATMDEALHYTRSLVAQLSPPFFQELGLPYAFKWLVEQLKPRGLRVLVDVQDERPSVTDDHAILLFHAARELLMNTLKHAGTDHARLAMTTTDGSLRIEITDDGNGFDVAALDSAPTSSRQGGFGLFSIRERMIAMGGRLELISRPHEGTRATLCVPLQPITAAGMTHAGPQTTTSGADDSVSRSASSATASKGIRVLLVDDHAMVRQGMRSILGAYADVEVVGEAAAGDEAISLVNQLRPSVVVMDINMPRMNGIEATREITVRHPAVVVIGLSVQADPFSRSEMVRAGAAALVTKEAAVEELYQAIQDSLQRKGRSDA